MKSLKYLDENNLKRMAEGINRKIAHVAEDVYTKEETDARLEEEIRGIFIGNDSHDFYMMTKSNISDGQEVSIPKPHDPYYKSVILGVQEFVEGDVKTDIIRTYDNSTKNSFQPNPYVSWDNGVTLITSKTIQMDPVKEMEDEVILHSTTIDLTEFRKLAIV